MSYDKIRESLRRCRQAIEDGDVEAEREAMAAALEQLVHAVEMDFAQIKAALGHLATLIERRCSS